MCFSFIKFTFMFYSILTFYYIPVPTFFFKSFTLSLYLKVFKVFSLELKQGLIFPIITVLQFPVKLSFKTYVNFEPRNGLWFLLLSNALIHSFNANNDLFISAPSILVYLWVSVTSRARSLPAKSINDIFEYVVFNFSYI